MRRADSSMAALASSEPEPAALEAQQRRDRLEVVLHPVVDLADGGVLRQQQPVAAAQLGDVADQHDGARHLAPIGDRQAPEHHGDLVAALDLLDGRLAEVERRLDQRLVEAELAEAQPLGVGVDADPVQRRHGVGRGVLDPPAGIEEQHAVAHPRAPRRVSSFSS